ncbi:MAG: hypothetical protein KatS3mg112_0511 [Thermogutta sp.]|nr:MAG: hypothetical protein KatS3mg112_0511 [Thermogutta sp.]
MRQKDDGFEFFGRTDSATVVTARIIDAGGAVLVLPILLLATLAVVQFGVLMLIEQTVTHAVTVAAREAGKGADIDATVLSVNAVLGLHGLSVGPGATLVLEDSLSTPAVQVRGTLPCSVPSTPSVPAGMLKATLCVDLTQKTVL